MPPSPWATWGARCASSSTTLIPAFCPCGFRLGDNDSRILAVARNLQAEGYDVTVVSKDLPLRIKASSVGLLAEEYRAELAVTDSGWTGMSELSLAGDQIDLLFSEESLYVPEVSDLPVHTGLVLQSERGKALGRVTAEGNVRLVRGDREAFGIHGRSAEQRIALDLLLDQDIGIVSMGGRAGDRQVGAGPVRGSGGGPGAQAASEGDGLPAAVRGRRPGARLSARQRGREDEPLGAGRLRHAVRGHAAVR